MNAPTTTRMSRVVIDLPASVPLVDLHRLAEQHNCRIVRRPDGSLLFRPQKGFTLIEILVVMTLIGILASIALPSYGSVLLRASVNEAISWSQPLTEELEAAAKEGSTFTFGPVANPMKRIESVATDGDTVVITLAGGTVILEPTNPLTDPVVGWSCIGGTLPATHRPAACRGES